MVDLAQTNTTVEFEYQRAPPWLIMVRVKPGYPDGHLSGKPIFGSVLSRLGEP